MRGAAKILSPISCTGLSLFLWCASPCPAADYYITTPAPPAVPSVAAVFKPGVSLSITGGAAGLDFKDFRVEWAQGANPISGWSDSGITLTGGGLSPVTDGLLASWSSPGATQSDYYSIRLLVDSTTTTNIAKTTVYLERDLYSSNWPKWLDQAPGGQSAVPFRDALGHTRLALINPMYSSSPIPSRLWLFELDGSSFTTNSLDNASSIQPAVADFEGGPADELALAEWNRLEVVRADGSSYELVPPRFSNFQHALVNFADLDADGRPEIVALGSDFSHSDGWLYAWKTNGDLLNSNFPVHIPEADLFDLGFNDANRVIQTDLDNDGYPELLVVGSPAAGSFSLHVVRGDGNYGTWPPLTFNGTFREWAVGDLDHDGTPEIVLAWSDATGSLVQVYSADGNPRAGWPVRLGGGLPIQVLLADLNRDGRTEIIVTEYATLYVFNADGSAFPGGWPLVGGAFQLLGTPTVADVDGDGVAEIVIARGDDSYYNGYYSELNLVAFRTNRTIARSWRLFGANGNQPASEGGCTIGDFDGDGQAELAVNYRVISGGGQSGYLHEGVLTLLSLGIPYRPHPSDWPMQFHDRRNSSAALVAARLRIAKSGNGINLHWPLQANSPTVEFTDDLQMPVWNPLPGPFALTNGFYNAPIATTNTHRWYRLKY